MRFNLTFFQMMMKINDMYMYNFVQCILSKRLWYNVIMTIIHVAFLLSVKLVQYSSQLFNVLK